MIKLNSVTKSESQYFRKKRKKIPQDHFTDFKRQTRFTTAEKIMIGVTAVIFITAVLIANSI